MEDTMTNLKGLRPTHLGELLREDVLPSLGKSKAKIAELLGISRQTLYDILGERGPITPAMALRFGKLLGNGPDFWVRMQAASDLPIEAGGHAPPCEAIPNLNA